jgi:hypothetical protein
MALSANTIFDYSKAAAAGYTRISASQVEN